MKRAYLATGFVFALATAGSSAAFAEPANKHDAAAAQTLFNDARVLMKAGNYPEACPKLEESLRLDDGIGTKFNLADCHEHVGKLATAWAEFVDAAAESKRQNQTAREKVARQRADALESRLPRLELVVTDAASGTEIRRDGVVVGSAAWGTSIPVDPGAHTIVATAPGKDRWEGTVTAIESTTATLTVPRLVDTQVAVAPPPPAASTTTTATVFTPVVDESRGRSQRTAGWIVAGVGVAGLAVGGVFGLKSMGAKSDSRDHCVGNACDATGVASRDDARSFGNVATIATIAGGALLVGGLVTVLTAPSTTSEKRSAVRATPSVGGVSIEGNF